MIVVYPARQPESNGTLVELDTYDYDMTLELTDETSQFVTFRFYEWATEQGYTFEHLPEDYQFSCVDEIDSNYGNFTTGISQLLY
jgi:hypothetical protein